MSNSIENKFQIVKQLLEDGRRKEATIYLAKILRQDPTNVYAWYLFGHALDDEAKKVYAFERVIKLDPSHKGAINQLERLREEPPGPPPLSQEKDLKRAEALLQSGQREGARASLVTILRRNPKNEHAWYLLGLALDSPPQKVYAFERVKRLNPSHQKAGQQLRRLGTKHHLRSRPEKHPTASTPELPKFSSSTLFRVTKYVLARAAMIFITIVIGVFGTVMIVNKSGQLDENIRQKIENQARRETIDLGNLGSEEQARAMERAVWEMEEEVGLHLPFLPRHLRWTYNALALDWGKVLFTNFRSIYPLKGRNEQVKDIVLQRLPNTLLLVGTADLLIFLIGIPLALFLARKHGYWQDRLISFLAPLSSVPSWVHGALLMVVFALELRLLPVGGMYDRFPPTTPLGYVPIVLKHMVLPVSAIVLSLFFQLVYAWRTFFLIYAHEDYVELARAVGLPFKAIERRHILRPSLPYVITSFALTLVSFWQTTTALEIVFDWPGIGRLYINALPHFWGESMAPGEMAISLAIVVIFAYLLGFMVLLLDAFYALVDPRVRMGKQGPTVGGVAKKMRHRSRARRQKVRQAPKRARQPRYSLKPVHFGRVETDLAHLLTTIRLRMDVLKSFLREFVRYPSAVFGLMIIVVLIGGSIYALIALPYAQVGELWSTEGVSGKAMVPKLAWPEWVNWFRRDDLLSTIVLNSRDGTASKSIQPGSNETADVAITFTFDYPFSEVPKELFLYFEPHYDIKRPFVFMTWVTPDGREIELKNLSIEADKKVNILDYIPRSRPSSQNPAEGSDFTAQTGLGDPELYVFFDDPAAEPFIPLKGTYKLLIEGILFEDNADLDAELVILGQVYGLAGTDYMRRDLLVPLLWGMPFALAFGLLGAVVTTVVSMFVAAAGVWFGGWVDVLAQRITEANMILPILAISVLFYALYGVSLWTILGIVVLLNVFGSPTKAFRAAFLQVKGTPYIEAAQAYGTSDSRIILRYMMPRVIPVLIPQLVALIPSYVFLEATLGMFNIKSNYPTWGKVIYQALRYGASYGSRYWVLEPIGLLLLTGFAFAMIGLALDRILNPRLRGL